MNKPLSKAQLSQTTFRRLLPLEPGVADASRQTSLTEKFLLPKLREVETFFLATRALIDPIQQKLQPVKLGKPYPLGQCLEITHAVKKLLQKKINQAQLDPSSASGYAAFSAFLAAGGIFRHAWGDLRGEYFQNAFQLGTLYLDVSNDTVTVTKPKVEILPFTESRFVAIADFHHFARLAERYWQHTVVPNHVLPDIAPYCPLIHVRRDGLITIRDPSLYMIALAETRQFVPSENVLRGKVMPTDIFEYITRVLAGTRLKVAASPEEGRTLALRKCREYRDKRWHTSPSQTKKIAALVSTANTRMADSHLAPKLYTGGSTINIALSTSSHPKHLPRYIPVSKTQHVNNCWRRDRDDAAINLNTVIPLTAQEILPAMMAMPLGFVEEGGSFILVGLRALTAGNNTFAIVNCGWPGNDMPEAWRHYPFALSTTRTGEELLCVDEIGGLLDSSEGGEPFFSFDGTYTSEVREVQAALLQSEASREAMVHKCATLQLHRLIQPWPFTLQIGEIEKNIAGLYRIDDAALKQVPANVLKELQLSGALALAYSQLFSMQNFDLQKYRRIDK
ncbi:MAG: SapC family protein [Pseudomonadota bacterium]